MTMLNAQEVLDHKFAPTKFREGYDVEDVDRFLDVVARALGSWEQGIRPELTAEDALGVRFSATKFREGYDVEDVDDFLDVIVGTLRAYEQRAATSGWETAPAEQAGWGTAPAMHAGADRPPLVADAGPLDARPLGLREATSQLQYAAVRTAGSDAVRAVGPDGRTWAVTGITTDAQGVIIQIH